MHFLDSQIAYTFSKIFALKIQTKDLVKDFGFPLTRKWLNLFHYPSELDRLEELQSRIEEILPYVDLAKKTTCREMLIAPIITDLIHYTRFGGAH